jgi:hypothetical protein
MLFIIFLTICILSLNAFKYIQPITFRPSISVRFAKDDNTKKGFGKVAPIVNVESEKDEGTKKYEIQAKRGVQNFVISNFNVIVNVILVIYFRYLNIIYLFDLQMVQSMNGYQLGLW